MAVIPHVILIVVLCNTGAISMTTKVVPRIIGDWWNPCDIHEDYDLCPRYQCVGDSCLHFLGLLKCQNRGENMPCRAECRCVKFYYRNREGKCIPQHDCVSTICGKNEIFKKCHPCNYARIRCANVDPKCRPGCYCKEGFSRDSFGECVEKTKFEQTEIKITGFNKTATKINKDDMIDLQDDDTLRNMFDLFVQPRLQKTFANETNLPNLKKISQTSFKILSAKDFDRPEKSKPLILFSNNDTTEQATAEADEPPMTTNIDKELTTITINTIDDDKDIQITLSKNDSTISESMKPNFYKYISVSLMENLNKSIITNITNNISNQTFSDIEHDLSDIQVTTTTSHDNLILFTFKKDYDNILSPRNLTKEVKVQTNSSSENIHILNKTNNFTVFNSSNKDIMLNETSILPIGASKGGIIPIINSTERYLNLSNNVNASLNPPDYNSITTFLFSPIQLNSTTHSDRSKIIHDTKANLNNFTEIMKFLPVNNTLVDKGFKLNIFSKETISTSTKAPVTKLSAKAQIFTIDLMPTNVPQNATISTNQIEKKHVTHTNLTKIPTKGLSFIW